MNSLEQLLSDWYTGEKRGEAFFLALAERAESPARSAKWRLLAELEHATAARLCRELQARDVALPDAQQVVVKAREGVAQLPDPSWPAMMKRLKPRLEGFVARFRAVAADAPAEAADVVAAFVRHEEALLEFVLAELEGKDGSPAVRALLPAAAGDEMAAAPSGPV